MIQTICREARCEARQTVSTGSVELVHFSFTHPPNGKVVFDDHFSLQLCLTSQHRGARGNFRDYWGAQRFEPVGAMFIVPPRNELHLRSDETAPISSLGYHLKVDSLLQWFDTLPAATDALLCASLDIHSSGVKGLLLQLADELRQPGFASNALIESLTTQVAIELFRHGNKLREDSAQGGLAPWQLRAIDARVKELRDAPSLAELANLCRVSVRQLARGFRASRGCSLGAFVADHQLEHAKRLLASDESIANIASKLGFSSSSNFCFAFRRATGNSPGHFRKTLTPK
jgi:AraC family transcriptional regulator